MATNIYSNYNQPYRGPDRAGKRERTAEGKAVGARTRDAERTSDGTGSSSSATVSFSHEGMDALANAKRAPQEGKWRARGGISSDMEEVTSTNSVGESGLSEKAQKYLESLRQKYGDYDFFVAGKNDDPRALMRGGTKEFSIVFSNEELERMAEDENYADEKLKSMERAVNMSKKISEQFGKDGVNVLRTEISFDNDGKMSIFTELEKTTEKQTERIRASREKRAEERKEAEEKEINKREEEKHKADFETVEGKRVSVAASSEEELMEKIGAIDWEQDAD
ncbi:MAG: hypothetical protein IJ833_06725 [Lachnospiraceae bacterium]|nr:hypothetical protein [Lachnospiraceae bacterium]